MRVLGTSTPGSTRPNGADASAPRAPREHLASGSLLSRRNLLTAGTVGAAGAILGFVTSPDADATPNLAPPRGQHPLREKTWDEGTSHGPWNVVYNGYGEVRGGADHVSMAPATAGEPGRTHACLVATNRRFDEVIDVTAHMRTDRQLRTGSAPNPWESAWLLWHHTDDLHFYALALKPNGWELSKEDPAYPGAQRYLTTGDTPRFDMGQVASVRVRQEGNMIDVWVDGEKLTSFTDTERPYTAGSVALYTEDAAVTFSGVRMFGDRLPER